jgi:hypothetical protein
MSEHYTEAELLETYYTPPGASLPVMMHLSDCGACAARFETLQKKIGFAHECRGACAAPRTPGWVRVAAAVAIAAVVALTLGALIVAP